MFLKMIFLLILLLNSGESYPTICKQGKEIVIDFKRIPTYSLASADGYKIEWKAAIKPPELAVCYRTVKLHYNGIPGTKCCYGYEAVTKRPSKTLDTKPFVVPLCGNKTKNVFISFQLFKSSTEHTREIKLKNLPPCPSDEEDEDWVFVASIVTGIAVFIIIVLCILYCFIKRCRNRQGDEESTGGSEEESGSDGSSSESSRTRKSSKASSTSFKSRSRKSSKGSSGSSKSRSRSSRGSQNRHPPPLGPYGPPPPTGPYGPPPPQYPSQPQDQYPPPPQGSHKRADRRKKKSRYSRRRYY